MKHVLWGASLLAIPLLIPTISQGDETGSKQSGYRLGEIIVTAEAERIVEQVGTVYTVTAEEIKARGAENLNEALQLVPGITIREGADGTPRIDIRGFRTRHVRLFLNGIPIRNSYDGQFDPTRIPAEIISEIKVTSGGSSILYGPGGNGGAIDIITKSGEEGLQGSLVGEIAEGDRYLGKGSLAGANEDTSFYGSVSLYDRDHFKLSGNFTDTPDETGDERSNSDRQRASVFGNLTHQLTDKTSLGFTISYVDGENGKPHVTNYDRNDPFTKKPKYDRLDDLQTALVQLALSHDTKENLEYRGWVYFSQSDEKLNRYDDDTYSTQVARNSFWQDATTQIYGAATQIRYGVGDSGGLTLGLTAEGESWDSDKTTIDRNGLPERELDDEELQTYTVGLEYEQEIGDAFSFVLGYGHYFHERDGDGDDNDFAYLLGLTYDLTETTQLRANHSRKIRFPSIKQLYDGDSANPNLETEVTLHYEAGIFQQLPGNSELGITGFVIDAEDFIEKDASDVNRNFQDLRMAGVELDLTTRPVEDLTLRFAVSYLHTEDKSSDSDRDELQYRPEWILTAECRYTFDFGLTAYGSIQHVANQYYYDADDTAPLLKAELDDFTVVSLKLSQKLLVDGLEIYLGADNLFDEDYEQSYGFPQPGRTIYGGIEYRF